MNYYEGDSIKITSGEVIFFSKHYPIDNIVSHEVTEYYRHEWDFKKILFQYFVAVIVIGLIFVVVHYQLKPLSILTIVGSALIVSMFVTWLRSDNINNRDRFKSLEYKYHRLTINTNGAETASYASSKQSVIAVQKALIQAINNRQSVRRG